MTHNYIDITGEGVDNYTELYIYDSIVKDRLTYVNKVQTNEMIPVFGYFNSISGKPTSIALGQSLYSLEWEGKRLRKIGSNISYTYNEEGIRINKVVNGVKTDYILDGDRIISLIQGDLRLDFNYDINGLLVGFTIGTEEYFYQRDITGNINKIIDSEGNVMVKYEYNAWGVHKVFDENRENTNPNFIGNINPFRYKGYYYDVETQLFYCNSRYYNPEWCRFISPDDVEYLDPSSISGLNLYAYCNNDPVNMLDSNGHSSISVKWFNLGNTFDLTSTLVQLLIGVATIGGQNAVLKAVRPNNIGAGLWNKQRATAIAEFVDDVAKLKKTSNILAAITVAIQVGEGIYTDANRGYSIDRVISNAVVNTAIYGGTMWLTGALGAQIGAGIGSFCPIPVVGTVVGTAAGFALGVIAGLILDIEIEGKSLMDHARDWVYDTWTSWFD